MYTIASQNASFFDQIISTYVTCVCVHSLPMNRNAICINIICVHVNQYHRYTDVICIHVICICVNGCHMYRYVILYTWYAFMSIDIIHICMSYTCACHMHTNPMGACTCMYINILRVNIHTHRFTHAHNTHMLLQTAKQKIPHNSCSLSLARSCTLSLSRSLYFSCSCAALSLHSLTPNP